MKPLSVRVQRGGQNVSDVDTVCRYKRGLKDLSEPHIPLENRWGLCNNAGVNFVFVARGRLDETPTVYDRARFESK